MDTTVTSSVATRTLESYAVSQSTALAHILGFGDETTQIADVVRRMLTPWGAREIGTQPRWRSDVCADGSPIEFSMAIGGGDAELRVLVEALSSSPTLIAMQQSARDLTAVLQKEYGAATHRLDLVDDLFFPAEPSGETAMMHAVIFRPGQPPDFKIYLNPMARGIDNAPHVLKEALGRLGFARAWGSVEAFARRGFDHDRVVYMSLDLLATPHARVKVYFRQYDATASEIDEAMTVARRHVPGQVGEFCRDVSGRGGRFDAQALGTCLTYLAEDDERPVSATFYVPLWTYSESDAVTRERISAALAKRALPSATYEAGLRSLARRPLETANGIHTYCSIKVPDGRPRITVYWSPELYSSRPPLRYERGADTAVATSS